MKPCPSCSMPLVNHAVSCDGCGWKADDESMQVNPRPSITPEQSAEIKKQEKIVSVVMVSIVYAGCAFIGGVIGWYSGGFVGVVFGAAMGAYFGPRLAPLLDY